MSNYSDYVASLTPVEVMHAILIRSAIWQGKRLEGKLHGLLFPHRRIKGDVLMNETSAIIRIWCKEHGVTVEWLRKEAQKRYRILPNGWIERKEGFTPFYRNYAENAREFATPIIS